MSDTMPRDVPKGGTSLLAAARHGATTARGLTMLALTAAATVSILQLSFWLEAPKPAAPVDGWRNLAVPGYTLVASGVEKPVQGRDLSHGGKASFRVATSDGQELGITLHLLPSRLRGTDDVSIAAITKQVPDLQLKVDNRRALDLAGMAPGAVLVGNLDRRRALQTCITPGGRSGIVTSELLADAQQPPRDSVVVARLRQIAGLQAPLRAECALMTVEASRADASEEELLAFARAFLVAWPRNPLWPAQPRQGLAMGSPRWAHP